MAQPLVSITMPAHNAQAFIAEAVEGILHQTYPDFELIIVDDCSSDDTFAIASSYAKKEPRITVVRNATNLKTAKTRNVATSKVKGKYILIMDADDWSYPDRISKQVAFMEAHPEVVQCGGAVEICNDKLAKISVRKYPQTDEEIRKHLFRFNPFANPATMIRAETARQVGFYNENLPVTQDYDLTFRLGRFGKFANLPDIVTKYRIHGTSLSQSKGRLQEKITLYVRLKAVMEYGYKMTPSDTLYTLMQLISMYIIPPKARFWLFNFFRNKVCAA
jgi:glycosyltransferase involved in cell wall biosynthesis